jgi:cyclomaltodextrinase / maltogenic alpha-amylase / neopullulanase
VTAFDVDYAWKLYHSISQVLTGREPASAISATWREDLSHYPKGALRMRFADNHDQLRATAEFGAPAALAADALVFTLDGVPMLYNGMEVGDGAESGAPALFERLPIYWPAGQLRPAFPATVASLIALRRSHSALTRGDLSWLGNSEQQRVLTFLRRSADETLLVALNLSSQPAAARVEGIEGPLEDITPAGAVRGTRPAPPPGAVTVRLAAWEYRVYRESRKKAE